MRDGLILLAVLLALIWISRDAGAQFGEVDRYLADTSSENFPRYKRLRQRAARHTPRFTHAYGVIVGVAGVVGGLILIARDL